MRKEQGFTLIELLVVVGILAALAAILVPNVAKFVGTGQAEGANAELDSVQAAVDAAIADLGLTAVTLGDEVADFGAYLIDGTTPLYPDYLRVEDAKYGPYDIDVTGKITVD